MVERVRGKFYRTLFDQPLDDPPTDAEVLTYVAAFDHNVRGKGAAFPGAGHGVLSLSEICESYRVHRPNSSSASPGMFRSALVRPLSSPPFPQSRYVTVSSITAGEFLGFNCSAISNANAASLSSPEEMRTSPHQGGSAISPQHLRPPPGG